MSESYDETNKRMSQALGPRSGIQTSADVAEAEAVQQAKREMESQANPALAGSHLDGWDGITFRCEPPDRFQFIYDKASNAIIIRDMQQEAASEEAVAASTYDPFQPIPASGAATVTFEPGIITNAGANISPTVGGGSTMATTPRPSLTITTTGTIYLEATVDAAGTATAIDTKNAASTPADTSTLKHLTLANVLLSGSTVTVTGRPTRESKTLFICNGTAIWD